MRVEVDPAPRPLKVVGAYALFVGMALMALGVLFRAYGVAPLEAYRVFLSVLGDPLGLAEVARRAIPLLLIGSGLALAFRVGFFNIGAEGQLYAGALAAVAVGGMHGGTGLEWSPYVLFPLMMLAAALAGAALLVARSILY